MKRIITLIFLAFAILSQAQTGFYIKPAINYLTFNRNHDAGGTFHSKSGTDIIVTPDNFVSSFPNFNLGIDLGYKTNLFFCEVGMYQDASANSIKITYITYNQFTKGTGQLSFTSTAALSQRSFPIKFGMKIFEHKSTLYKKLTSSFYLYTGIQPQINYGEYDSTPATISGNSYTTNGLDSIDITIYTIRGGKRVFNPMIGLLFEVKNHNNCNLFNLNISYNFGLKHRTALQYRNVEITDIDGTSHLIGDFYATGEGLYLSISKCIYFNRIFKKRIKKPND